MTDPADHQPGSESVPGGVVLPLAPESARRLFGSRLVSAERYAELLAGEGVEHGHIGPREVPRLWDRHLVNSALLAELIPPDAGVLDVGSGAGLPGLPIALARPDLQVTLLEPMLRRSQFLSACVQELGIADQVSVVRGRAEEQSVLQSVGGTHWLVARAVAPLDRLTKWCLPLVAPGGIVLAMKGSSAMAEVSEHRAALQRLGVDEIHVVQLGGVDGDEGTRVVSIRRGLQDGVQRRARRDD